MPTGDFGPRLQATVGYLSGRLGMSHREITETLGTVFQIDLGLGSIPTLETVVSDALAQPVADAQTYVQRQAAANVDETGWREHAQHAWLWVAATPWVSVFLVLTTRSATGVRQLLGETVRGIVSSDRWTAYNCSTHNGGKCVGHTSNATFKNWSSAAGPRNGWVKPS